VDKITFLANKSTLESAVRYYAGSLGGDGKTYQVTIEEYVPERTMEQNDHLNSHITEITKETGQDRDTVEYETLKKAIPLGYPCITDPEDGKVIPKRQSRRNRKEISCAIEAVHMLAAEMDIPLTETEEWE
jgi:hypothetical protein